MAKRPVAGDADSEFAGIRIVTGRDGQACAQAIDGAAQSPVTAIASVLRVMRIFMLVLEIGFVREARRAQINAGDARLRMIEGIARGRVTAAAGDQNVDILPRRPVRPECMPVTLEITAIPFAADCRGVEVGNGKGVHPFLILPGDRAVLACGFFQRRLPPWTNTRSVQSS